MLTFRSKKKTDVRAKKNNGNTITYAQLMTAIEECLNGVLMKIKDNIIPAKNNEALPL